MQQLKKQAAVLLSQINTAKNTGMLNGKASEAEKAVDMSARLMIGMLAKMEELEAKLNETAS